MSIKGMKIGCDKFDEKGLSEDIKYLKIQDILAKDLSDDFLYQIENTEENNFTSAFEVSGEYNILYICEKNVSEIKAIPRDMVERQAFSKKFNQLSNTYISNNRSTRVCVGGYCNVTAAIDGVQFAMSSGNIDAGTIKLYGIKDS